MRLMVLTKQQRWQFGFLHLRSQRDEFLRKQIPEQQLFLQPHRHGRDKRLKALRSECQIGFEQPLKFHERLIVEDDISEIPQGNATFLQTVVHCMRRKPGIMLLSRKPLFLRRRDNLPLTDQARSTIMIER